MTHRLVLLSGAAGLALAACSSEPPPAPPAPPAPPKVEAPKPAPVASSEVKGTTDAAPAFTYTYAPGNRRDPFRSPMVDAAANPGSADAAQGSTNPPPCPSPLCRWDLEQFKLVGVVSGMSNPVAMVEDPQGVGHMVRRNAFIGKKGGRVTSVKADSVEITETLKDVTGKPHPQKTTLALPKGASDIDPTDLLDAQAAD